MKFFKFLMITLLATSCASIPRMKMPSMKEVKKMQAGWLSKNCNIDSAYSMGVENAQNGDKHDASSFSGCSKEIGAIKRSYSEGYTSVTNSTASIVKGMNEKHFYKCTLSIFGKEYISTGENLGKVKHQTSDKCKAHHHEVHCSSGIECEKL